MIDQDASEASSKTKKPYRSIRLVQLVKVWVCITQHLRRASLQEFRTQAALTPPSVRSHGLTEHVKVVQIHGEREIVIRLVIEDE